MKPAKFRYYRASNLAEAIHLLAEAGDDARVLGGGQSLVPMMNFRSAQPGALVDITACHDLQYVRLEDGVVSIGAATPQLVAQRDEIVLERLPLMSKALERAGPRPVRNRATVGGGLANGYPMGHLVCVAKCLEAEIRLVSRAGERVLAAADFFLDALSTDLAAGELLHEVRFPAAKPGDRCDFQELGNHRSGTAVVMLASQLTCNDAGQSLARFGLAGVLGVPIRLPAVEALIGRPFDHQETADAIDTDLVAAGYEDDPGDKTKQYARQVAPYLIGKARAALAIA